MSRSYVVEQMPCGRFYVGTSEQPKAFSVDTLDQALNLVSFLLDRGEQPLPSGKPARSNAHRPTSAHTMQEVGR